MTCCRCLGPATFRSLAPPSRAQTPYKIYAAGEFMIDITSCTIKRKYNNAREGIPRAISIAEPNKIGG